MTPPTSHPRAPTSVPPSGSALAPSTHTSSTAQYASAGRCWSTPLRDRVTTHTGPKVHIEIDHSRPTTIVPARRTTRRGTHGCCVQPTRPHVLHRHGSGHAILFHHRTHLRSQRPPRLHGQMIRGKVRASILPPFFLETTGRPGYHIQKFIKYLSATRTTHHHPSATLGQRTWSP